MLKHKKCQSCYSTHDPSYMVEIIGIRYDAFHDHGYRLNILWQNAVSDLDIFDHQRVNIFLGSMLERFTWRSKVDHSEIWSFVRCVFLPSSCILRFIIMETIYRHCKQRIKDLSNSLGQYLGLKYVLNVAHILMMMILISDSQFMWR